MQTPHEIYAQLLEHRGAEIVARELRHRRLGYWQLAAAAAAGVVIVAALGGAGFSVLWAAIPAAALVGLMVIHERLLGGLERHRRAARFYEKGLARVDGTWGTWAGSGESGERYLDPAHPYAQDLDLFGKGSLFELLSTARTHIGEDTLARWLTSAADPATVRTRQQAVDELRPRLDLREELAVLAEEAHTGVDPVALAAWGEAPPLLAGSGVRAGLWVRTALGIAGAVALLTLMAYYAGLVTLGESTALVVKDAVLLTLAINGWFLYSHRRQNMAVVAALEEAGHGLGLLTEVLVRLEREKFKAPLLAALGASLAAEGVPPSRRMARLKRLTEYLDSRDNVFVRVAEVFLLWTPHVAWEVEDWRRHSGAAVRRWLEATGQMEALCSLASHAFEHPSDPFPEFVEEGPWLEAEALGHPLIDERKVVRNDVRLGGGTGGAPGGQPRLLIVSGSNMSGKSTLLRTLGVNVVLAQAGGPVRARRLCLSPLALGASIRVTDSLQSGISRFYAEILRLRQILDLTGGPHPVLFLVDEFLHGTNSHDRKIGAEAVARSLVERGAIGLITTHDLALADIAGALGERAANVHFEDRIEDGRVVFDYVMRPGVVRKSNALELMRSVGLDI